MLTRSVALLVLVAGAVTGCFHRGYYYRRPGVYVQPQPVYVQQPQPVYVQPAAQVVVQPPSAQVVVQPAY